MRRMRRTRLARASYAGTIPTNIAAMTPVASSLSSSPAIPNVPPVRISPSRTVLST